MYVLQDEDDSDDEEDDEIHDREVIFQKRILFIV